MVFLHLKIVSTWRTYTSVWVLKIYFMEEFLSPCELTKIVFLHSKILSKWRSYTSVRQKSSWRAWACIHRGRKTIVQDSILSWKTETNSNLPAQETLHMTVCYMNKNSYIEIFQHKMGAEEQYWWKFNQAKTSIPHPGFLTLMFFN